MKKVTLWLDPSLETVMEEWLWFQNALSVSSLPEHVTPRKLEALFEDLDQEGFQNDLEQMLARMDEGFVERVSYETVVPEAWQTRWRENFQPLQIGSFRLVGEWEEAAPDPKMVRIYPGQAFGTGQHETTQLIIRRLEQLDLSQRRVLDIGCGTGILAIVAERLGAASVYGFDNDPDAAENMQRHLRINETRVTTLEIATIDQLEPASYDLILANITLNVLIEVWPRVPAFLAQGGVLISSGLLAEQQETAQHHLKKSGFTIDSITGEGEWIMIEARRP